MLEKKVERDLKPYPFKQGGKAQGRTKRIGIYCGMGSGRERMYWACLDVVVAEQLMGKWVALKRCSQQTKMVGEP